MLSVPYRKSHIPQPIADRDKQIAYLKEELKTARFMIQQRDQRIQNFKNGRDILLKRNHDLEREKMDLSFLLVNKLERSVLKMVNLIATIIMSIYISWIAIYHNFFNRKDD